MLNYHVKLLKDYIDCYSYKYVCTNKPVNKGHPRERQHMVFIDKWPIFGGYIFLFYQGRITEVWPLFTWLSLFRGGL